MDQQTDQQTLIVWIYLRQRFEPKKVRRLQMSMDTGHVRCMMKGNALAVYHCVTRSEQMLYCRRLCRYRLSEISFEVFSISAKRPLKTQHKLYRSE